MRLLKPSKFIGQIWKGACYHCEAEFECDIDEIHDKINAAPQTVYRHNIAVKQEPYAELDCLQCKTEKGVTFHYDRTADIALPEVGKPLTPTRSK